MEFFTVDDKASITTIVRYMVSEGMEVKVEIEGADETFGTRMIAIKEFVEGDRIIVEKLYPQEGNTLIQSAPHVQLSFDLKDKLASFATTCMGMNSEAPLFGLILDIPTSIQLEEKRSEERISEGLENILSVSFTLESGDKQYQLPVGNIGSSGMGLIVEKANFDLFEKIKLGDLLRDIMIFLPVATMTIDAAVKHMTLIKEGQFRGCYLLGIEAASSMDFQELKEEIEKIKQG
ncbi:MAG: hypothetical protein ACOC6E_03295 [Thermodesulfobacteriota bacterium]